MQEQTESLILHQHDENHVSGIIDVKWPEKQDRIWETLVSVDRHLENMQEKDLLCESEKQVGSMKQSVLFC